MNIAFPAFLLFLLILPGLIFNLTLYKIEDTPLLNYVSLTSKAIVSLIFAVILHFVWVLLFIYLFHYHINSALILILVSGAGDNQFPSVISSITNHELFIFIIYFVSLCLISHFLGMGVRGVIRYLKLEKIFRIDSPWYYLFTGYDWQDGKPDGVRIAAIVEIGGKGYLYIGWLDKFYLDSNGNINQLVLTSTMR